MLRLLTRALCVVTTTAAALVVVMLPFDDGASPWGIVLKAIAAAVVVSVGVAFWAVDRGGAALARRLLVASVALVTLAVVGAFWTLGSGARTGDVEYWALGISALVAIQGILIFTYVRGRLLGAGAPPQSVAP